MDFEATHGVHVIHEVFITHPHFDHFAQLDWLSMALLRNGRDDQPRPLPIYATRACWEAGPNAVHRYLSERSEFRPIEPGGPIIVGDIVLTPLAVDHGPKAPGAVGFVVQHGDRKVVLTGDFLRIPNEDDPLLSGADVCFMDANTWHPAEWTSHSCVLGNLRLIRKWRPKRATRVRDHNGHGRIRLTPDPFRPFKGLTHGRLPQALSRAAGWLSTIDGVAGRNLGGRAIRYPWSARHLPADHYAPQVREVPQT